MLMPDLGVLATGLGQAVAGERSGGTGRTCVVVRKHGNESMRSGVPTTPSPLAEMPCPANRLIRTMRWAVEAIGRGGLPWAPGLAQPPACPA